MKRTLLFVCAAGALFAQPSPVIQTETREVLVDAIVTAKNGAYVGDLTAKDFHIAQDGKEQAIKGFAVESGPSAEQTRSMVLFFDQTSMEARDEVVALRAAGPFIDAEAGPNHRMAIITFNGSMRIAQNFTDNPGRLKDALSQANLHGLAPSAADSDRSHDPSRKEEDLVVGRANASAMATSLTARDMVHALAELARSLGVLPGRKIVIVFAGALPSGNDPKAEVHDAIEAANKSSVAFYPIDVRPVFTQTDPGAVQQTPESRPIRMGGPFGQGPGAQGDPGMANSPIPDSGASGQQILANLSGGTGGFPVRNTSDLLAGLQNVGKEQDQYYVLTYVAPDSKEGTCHSLKVKVDRKQTTVRARTTYCAEKPLDLLAGTASARGLEKRAAETQAGGIGASMEVPYFYVAPNVARVDVAMEIPADVVKFENRKGKPHAEVNFLGIATGADGQARGRFSDVLKLDFDSAAQVENLKGKFLHYEKEFKIAAGEYSLTVTFGQDEASFGKVQSPLVVDSWAGDFGLSALALSRETHPAADLGLVPALEGRTPLVAQGAQIVPSGAAGFARAEPVFVYFEIYGQQANAARVRLRLLDSKTGQEKWDGGSLSVPGQGEGGNPKIPAGAKLPVESLAPGAYRLEVTATDTTGKLVKRTADFELR